MVKQALVPREWIYQAKLIGSQLLMSYIRQWWARTRNSYSNNNGVANRRRAPKFDSSYDHRTETTKSNMWKSKSSLAGRQNSCLPLLLFFRKASFVLAKYKQLYALSKMHGS